MKNVCIFGDSITKGILLNSETGRYYHTDIDFSKMENEFDVKITNYSKMGCVIEKGFEIIKRTLENVDNIDIAFFEFGGNDADYNWNEVASMPSKDYESKTNFVDFEKKLREIICFLREKNIKPILMTLPPISATKYFNWFTKSGLNIDNIMYFLGDIDIIYRKQELFSSILQKVAIDEKVEIVDVRKEFLVRPDFIELICEDGIHPNSKGQKIILDTITKHFELTRKS